MTVQAPPRPPQVPDERTLEAPPASTPRAMATAALVAGAAAWMISGLFVGTGARLAAFLGVAIGVGITYASTRTTRPSLVQYLVLPAGAVAGALLALPDTGGGDSLQSLVVEAIRTGGLAQPPVPFDPGWRFLLVVIVAVLSGAAASIAYAARPQLAITLTVPIVIAAGVAQPEGAEVTAAVVALGFILAALAVASGDDLGEQATAGFEARRLVRGAGTVLALAVVMVAISRAGFLFPETTSDRIVPAQRPPVAGPQPDRVLFTVEADTAGPWRLGVLDVYDGLGWLLPPLDPARLVPVPADGTIEGAPPAGTTVRATFTVADLPGRTLPGLAEPIAITNLSDRAEFDPRTQMLRLPEGRAREGLTYTMEAPGPPSGRALAEAPRQPPAELVEFLSIPQAPNQIAALLADAPQNPWDRLVFLRAQLYANVVAAGAGDPVDVPPARAAELVAGGEGTPFEITATEAMLARWAGVPSRIGFGFFGGDAVEDAGAFEVRPRHGATWLEVYFDGHGWVPIVGVPPRARASLSPEDQRADPNVTATDELALVVYVPVQLRTVRLLVVTVRYWLGLILPPLLGLVLLWWLLPGVFKLARTRARRRWARARGARERILAAYAQFRDVANDLGAGHPGETPLGFVESLEPDEEHTDLAWLVTRALWGDLRRDLRAADADAAERMSVSLIRRLRASHPPSSRLLAFGTRVSLRTPYTDEVPNPWPAWARERPIRTLIRRARLARRAAAATLVMLLGLTACARTPQVGVGEPGALPDRIVPEQLAGLLVEREPDAEDAFARAGDGSLVEAGRIYTLRDGPNVEGYVEVAAFRAGVDTLDTDVRRAILRSIGAGTFRLERIGDERAWVQDLPEQRIMLTFTDDGEAMTLLVTRKAFERADETFIALARYQRGDRTGERITPDRVYDPRTGESR